MQECETAPKIYEVHEEHTVSNDLILEAVCEISIK